jgi:4-hydroxy-3-polyprenylbenzoate decarboxylase
VGAFTLDKHWGCKGSLILDARTKPHLAPPLLENEQTTKRIEELAIKGGPLHGLF